jgi:hypothetical protein
MDVTSSVLKERLMKEAEKLPEQKLQEVLDFVDFLLSKERQARKREKKLDPTKDPLLKFIAGVSHGSLAKDIDNELYGK